MIIMLQAHLVKFLPLDCVMFIVLMIRSQVCRVQGVVLSSLDKILVHNPHKGLIVVKAELVEQ